MRQTIAKGMSKAIIVIVAMLVIVTEGGAFTIKAEAADKMVAAGSAFAYVGSYTSAARNGHGEGISVYSIDSIDNNEEWHLVQVYKDFNPSFLTMDRAQQYLYAVHGDGEKISAFHIDKKSGQIELINEQPTGGMNAVSLAVDPTNQYVIVANYDTGTVASMPINPDGSLKPVVDLVTLTGKLGPYRFEQSSSHPHDVKFDPSDRIIVVPDKGLDKVFLFRIDPTTGKLSSLYSSDARYGAGPRHVAFHPTKSIAYVVNEMASTVSTYKIDVEAGVLKQVHIAPALPPTSYTDRSVGAEVKVHPSGKYVFASNRGHDSIVTFKVDQNDGTLSPITWEPTQGSTPRFFALNGPGSSLYVANQDSDSIVVFRIQSNGKLIPTGQIIKIGSPSCILFKTK